MKDLGPASENDLPPGLIAAMRSDDVVLCHTCDGFRVRDHVCRPFGGWKHADGTPYTDAEERGLEWHPSPPLESP